MKYKNLKKQSKFIKAILQKSMISEKTLHGKNSTFARQIIFEKHSKRPKKRQRQSLIFKAEHFA